MWEPCSRGCGRKGHQLVRFSLLVRVLESNMKADTFLLLLTSVHMVAYFSHYNIPLYLHVHKCYFTKNKALPMHMWLDIYSEKLTFRLWTTNTHLSIQCNTTITFGQLVWPATCILPYNANDAACELSIKCLLTAVSNECPSLRGCIVFNKYA